MDYNFDETLSDKNENIVSSDEFDNSTSSENDVSFSNQKIDRTSMNAQE